MRGNHTTYTGEAWPFRSDAQVINPGLGDGTRYFRQPPPSCYDRPSPEGLDCREFATLTSADGALYLGAFLLLAVVLLARPGGLTARLA